MRSPRFARPLDRDALQRLALHYVGRYATTRAKLTDYLKRKVNERGWADEAEAPIATIVEHCASAGYVDDEAFAVTRAAALTRRGYGERRIADTLAQAGIAREAARAFRHDEDEAFAAAETLARRKRFGPFADTAPDEAARRRAFAALVRAGHGFALARRFSRAQTDPE